MKEQYLNNSFFNSTVFLTDFPYLQKLTVDKENDLTTGIKLLFNIILGASGRSTQLPKGDLVGPLIDFGCTACSAPIFL